MELKDYKRIVWDLFIGIIAFSLFIIYYKIKNPSFLPGITEKIVWVISILLLLVIILSLNYDRIITNLIAKKMMKLRKYDFEDFSILSTEDHLKKIINYIFHILLIIFLIVLLINEFKPINFINMNYFLIAVLVFGIITVFAPPISKSREINIIIKRDHYFIWILGILGAVLIFIKIKSLGWLSYIISIIGGVLIILLSYLLLEEEENET